jgi:RNA polymerase sigma factor (sigma-70 family)
MHPERASELATEAVQEALTRACELRDQPGHFAAAADLQRWVVVVARNYAFDRGRRVIRRQETDLPEDIPSPAPSPLAPFLEPLLQVIDQLPPEDRVLVQRKFVEGQTYREIGQELFPDLTPNAALQRVRNRIIAILARLGEMLEGQDLTGWLTSDLDPDP